MENQPTPDAAAPTGIASWLSQQQPTEPTPPTGEAAPAEPETVTPPPTDWNSDDNPYKQQYTGLSQEVTKYVADQALKQEQAAHAQADKLFADGEIDQTQYAAVKNQLIQRRDQQWQDFMGQVMAPYWAQDHAKGLAKDHGLTEAELAELTQVSPHAMDDAARIIVERRNYVPKTEVDALTQRLDQLERGAGAQRIVESGANASLGGGVTQGEQIQPGTRSHLRSFLREFAPDLYQQG